MFDVCTVFKFPLMQIMFLKRTLIVTPINDFIT